MDGSGAGWPVDADFVDYVRARQHTLLRAAYLVCGDVRLAEELLRGALRQLARQWEQVRDEQPDVVVRRVLYRDAVSSWRRRGHDVVGADPADSASAAVEPAASAAGAPGPGAPEPEGREPVGPVAVEGEEESPQTWEGEEEDLQTWEVEEVQRRLDVLRALDSLTPRQRAVVVLRHFEERDEHDTAEILGCSVGTVLGEAEEALARLRAALPRVDLEAGGAR